jgi:hypothetical protein
MSVSIHSQNQKIEKRLLLGCRKTGQNNVHAVIISVLLGIDMPTPANFSSPGWWIKVSPNPQPNQQLRIRAGQNRPSK